MKVQRRNLLGFTQQFDGLVSPALVNTQQAELHKTVGDQVVVEPDLLLTGHTHGKKQIAPLIILQPL